MTLSFALNRTCAPQLPLTAFIDLAVSVGVRAVEIRNDIEGREFHDGTTAAEVRARLHDAGLVHTEDQGLDRSQGDGGRPDDAGTCGRARKIRL